jgi:type II pantothenate kinase
MYVAAQDPGAYGKLGLSDLFEMREECLREFGFSDVYRLDKQNENSMALQVSRVSTLILVYI